MKNIFTLSLLCLSITTFAQDTKKDSVVAGSVEDYGMRMYDTRTLRYMSVDPVQQPNENNPYQFADTTKQPADEPKTITTTN